MNMIDHITIKIADYKNNRNKYVKLLSVLGYKVLFDDANNSYCGLGQGEKPTFWLSSIDDTAASKCHSEQSEESPRDIRTTNVHIALTAESKEKVDEFYRTALEQGFNDNGQPGYRPEYHEDYYACFVLDQGGNNLEAVFGN
jgi:catechol 2,3-dioxygenase-like lactoylglutathione lyase family enzyme